MAYRAGGVRAGAEARRTLVAEEVVSARYEGRCDFPVTADVTLSLAGEALCGGGGVRRRRAGTEGPDAAGGRRRLADAFIAV